MDPPAANVRFDTKWTNLKGNHFVTVKKNTQIMQRQCTGVSAGIQWRKTAYRDIISKHVLDRNSFYDLKLMLIESMTDNGQLR